MTIKNNTQNDLKLQKTVRFFETFLRASADGIVITDPANNIIFVNDTFCKIFSSNRHDVIETNLFIWLAKLGQNAKDIWKELETQIKERGIAKDVEFSSKTGEGMRYFSVNSSLLEKIDIEEAGLIISIWRDDTERKMVDMALLQAHDELEQRVDERTGKLVESQKFLMNMVEELNQTMEALHESKERYRMLVEFSPDGIMVHDTEKFTFANKAASDILGASSPEELIGKTVLDIIHPDYMETVSQRLQIEKEGKEAPLIEQKFLRMDGTPIDVEVVAFPIKYEGRIEVHSVVRDITERKKLIDAIKAANVRLIEIDRLKSAFLATMSHELRTPLNSIIGYTGLILMGYSGSINDEQKKQLDMVNTSANHLLSLIVDILDISKIESGQLKIYNAPFMMKTAIDNAVQIVVPLAQTKGLELHVEVSPHVRVIRSDQKRIEQILINLLGNAIKFTEKGEVKLECYVRDDQLITRIIDTGIGIKPENMDRLFKPFLQLDNGLTRRYEGTGLGLSICKKLIEMLGGRIWAESEIGKGSVFTFTLPVKGETT